VAYQANVSVMARRVGSLVRIERRLARWRVARRSISVARWARLARC
jgi:hypothetical protein